MSSSCLWPAAAPPVTASAVPERLREWLFATGSLTRRLEASCPGAFVLELIGQRWQRPRPDEALALGLDAAREALVRHVLMRCGARALVFARSVIPADTLHAAGERPETLASRSLADMLFADASLEREEVALTELGQGEPLLEMASRALGTRLAGAWARRSVFRLRARRLLVIEVFLPALADTGCEDDGQKG